MENNRKIGGEKPEPELDWVDGVLLSSDISPDDFIRWPSNSDIIMQGTVTKDTPIEAGYRDYRDYELVVDVDMNGNRHIAPNEVQNVTDRKVMMARFRDWMKEEYVVNPHDVIAVSPDGEGNWYQVFTESD